MLTPASFIGITMPCGLNDNLVLVNLIEDSINNRTYKQAEFRSSYLEQTAWSRLRIYELTYKISLPERKIVCKDRGISALDLCHHVRTRINAVIELLNADQPIPLTEFESGLCGIASLADVLDELVEKEMKERFIPMFQPLNTEIWQNDDNDYDEDIDEYDEDEEF